MERSLRLTLRSGILVGTTVLVLCPALPASACQSQPNPIAFKVPLPGEAILLPNGMMALTYVNRSGEHTVHVTVHRVFMILRGLHPLLPEAKDPRYRVLETEETLNPMTYLIATNPLYYGIGIDSLGFPTQTWIDPEEDGLNGNEHPTYQRSGPPSP